MVKENLGTCVLLINDNNEILLGERLNSYRSGVFGLPGGKLELEEALEACAARELKEETGIEARQLKYVGVIRELQEGYNFIHFVYSCDDFEGEPINMEPEKCGGWNWYGLDSLPKDILRGHVWAIDIFQKRSNQLRDVL